MKNSAEDITKAIVRVNGSRSKGTGFFIDVGTIVTCFHVVGNESGKKLIDRNLTVSFGREDYHVQCISHSADERDVAILRIIGKLPDNALILPLGQWQNGAKEDFSTYGFRGSSEIEGLFAKGNIRGIADSDTGVEWLQLAAQADGEQEIRGGMSGAPVYHNDSGQIIGMIAKRKSYNKRSELIPFAISMQEIGKVWGAINKRIREERRLQQLRRVFDFEGSDPWFTKKSFKAFYAKLLVFGLEPYDDLGENKQDAFIASLRKARITDEVIYRLRLFEPNLPLVDYLTDKDVEVSDISFVNRQEEFEKATARFTVDTILFEAPIGFGKTTLLREIERHYYYNRGWVVFLIPMPPDLGPLSKYVEYIFSSIGQSEDASLFSDDLEIAGQLLAQRLYRNSSGSAASGAVILLDSLENLPYNSVHKFRDEFLFSIMSKASEIKDFKILLRLAGRQIGAHWTENNKSIQSSLKLRIEQLSPFRNRYIEETLSLHAPIQTELQLRAALIMHYTGGHPGCMAEILGIMNYEEPAEKFFQVHNGLIKEHVLDVAEEVFESIPNSLKDSFYFLSVFRRYNLSILTALIEQGIICNYKGGSALDSAEALEAELASNYLVQRKNGFIQDAIVRRLLAIRLRYSDRDQYLKLCRIAREVFLESLILPTSSMPEYLLIEGIFSELNVKYFENEESEKYRKNIRNAFFDKEGILYSWLSKLRDRQDAKDIKKNLLVRLQDYDEKDWDWEFSFAINFYMRESSYTPAPYHKMLEEIENFPIEEVR